MSTPPTVHDSDRKAAEEISKSVTLLTGKVYHGLPHIASLAIARHHAEERAAMEKAERALEDAKLRMVAMGWDNSPHYPQNAQAIRDIDAALTALRTASQSPTP